LDRWFRLCIAFAYKISNNFRYDGEDISKIKIEAFEGNTLNLMIGDEDLFNDNYYDHIFEVDNFEIIKMDDDYYMNEVQLEITESETDKISLTIRARATGKTYKIADRNAKEIEYGIRQDGNTLYLDEFLKLPQGVPYLDQSISLELKVPLGYKIVIDDNMYRLLYHDRHYRYNHRRLDRYFEMTKDGLEKIEQIIEDEIDDIGRDEKIIHGGGFHKLGFSMFNHIAYTI